MCSTCANSVLTAFSTSSHLCPLLAERRRCVKTQTKMQIQPTNNKSKYSDDHYEKRLVQFFATGRTTETVIHYSTIIYGQYLSTNIDSSYIMFLAHMLPSNLDTQRNTHSLAVLWQREVSSYRCCSITDIDLKIIWSHWFKLIDRHNGWIMNFEPINRCQRIWTKISKIS